MYAEGGPPPGLPKEACLLGEGKWRPRAEATLANWGGYNGCSGVSAIVTSFGSYNLHEIDCNGVMAAPSSSPRC